MCGCLTGCCTDAMEAVQEKTCRHQDTAAEHLILYFKNADLDLYFIEYISDDAVSDIMLLRC